MMLEKYLIATTVLLKVFTRKNFTTGIKSIMMYNHKL